MRLLSATVRAYRLHRETTVVFDPSRTLIGGPNETGKSTFAEAVHRALFLKARGNTAEHRAMKSTLHLGTPEVELFFECGGGPYQLKKRFGSSGDTTLTPPQGTALTGEAAEAELARLLGVESGASGKTAVAQWSHLWVWQGQSAGDPTPHATSQKDGLLQRLQTLGGAAAMQSERDSRTAAAAAAARDACFSATGKLKASSPLALAEAEAAEAGALEEAARTRAASLQESVQAFTRAESELVRLAADLMAVSAQHDGAVRQDALICQHRGEEAVQAHADAAAQARLLAMEQHEAQLAGIRQELSTLEAELVPLDAATAALTAQSGAAREAAAAASQAFEAAGDAATNARQQHDLAQAWIQQHETGSRLAVLKERAAEAAAHQAETGKLQIAIAALPPVDGPALAILQKCDAAQHAAAAALTAMAAGVELLDAGGPVLLSGESMAAGESRILTEAAVLELGTRYRLRIRPGGGTSLAGAREKEHLARQQFQAALEKSGVRSVEEAAAASLRRADLTSGLMAGQAALKSLQADSLPAALAEAKAACAAAAADTARRVAALASSRAGESPTGPPSAAAGPAGGAEALPTMEAARAALAGAALRLSGAEAGTARTKALREAALRSAAGLAAALASHSDSLRQRHTRHTGLLAQQDYFLTTHGDDATRTAALQTARQQRAASAATLAWTRQTLHDLQPEQTARTLDRLKRSTEQLHQQRSDAGTRLAVAADQLRSDGSQDPAVTLALATARAATAADTLQRLRRQAEARRLLHDLFTAEQQALADCFTRPLADAISGYLECLFGQGARATVALEDHEFTGLKLERPHHPGGAIAFDDLSGGTREQTAAAVRLAMAEVLAPAHHGCLPVIFDDAFAHSDATRLQQLQSMLDLAATRGLQIILLTCAPADYAALGAAPVAF